MGIFSRLGDIINSNLNAMLDRAEDPEKIVRLAIQEMEDTLVEVRQGAARSIAEKKNLTRKIAELETRQAEWEDKASFALDKDREDLARAALLAKDKGQETIDLLRQALIEVEESLSRSDDDLKKLQSKLEEAKAKQKALDTRRRAVSDQVRMRSQLHDSRIDDALERYAGVERKLDELEGHAESLSMGRSRSLEEEFAELEAESRVDAEMARLRAKAKAGKSAPEAE